MSNRQRHANWKKAREGAQAQLQHIAVLSALQTLRRSMTLPYLTRAELIDELDDLIFTLEKQK